jgi:hypothetical protein
MLINSLLLCLLSVFYLTYSFGSVASSTDITLINNWSNATFEKVNYQSMRKLHKTMRNWSAVHFGASKLPVMYFFSGADLYTMMGLFPQAPAYALVAEFFPGDINCFKNEQCRDAAQVKASSWYSHVETRSFGYSVTVSMRQFFAPPWGILPAVLLILRTFNHIIQELETTETGFTIKTNRATICYEKKFILNLEALQEVMSLKSMPPKPWAMMFKAGAHDVARNPWFTKYILANSAMIVQDETGLRATAFQGNWTVKVYGQYHPFTGNGTRFIEDMEEFKNLFLHRKIQQLPFCFGYCSEYHTRGMLILAETPVTRKGSRYTFIKK